MMGQRIGFMGGTFDPPHIGHLILASNAKQNLDLDEVWFIPAGNPYRKEGEGVSSADDRLAMLEKAVDGIEWAQVKTYELERAGPTYTIDTVLKLPNTGILWWFILGSDALVDMEFWKEPERIIDLVRLAVGTRPGVEPKEGVARLESRLPGVSQRIDYVEMPEVDISSRDVRNRIRAGKSTEFLLQNQVQTVIEELGLYKQE
tara:strand:- start:267 stop:875 length:609 start_codon:yes stop_codon:yes gene_type:complete